MVSNIILYLPCTVIDIIVLKYYINEIVNNNVQCYVTWGNRQTAEDPCARTVHGTLLSNS